MVARALLVLGLVVGGCAHVPPLDAPGVPQGYPIEEVEIVGAESVDEDALIAGLANRPPEFELRSRRGGRFFSRTYFRYDVLQTELDRRRIRSFYERQGYFGVEVSGPELERVGDEYDRWRVVWTVDEGSHTRVERLRLTGAPEGTESTLRRLSGLKPGTPYVTATYDGALTRLRAHLVKLGYASAEVSGQVRIDRDRGQAEVVLNVEPGPLIRMDDLLVDGLERTPPSLVRGRKTWEPGDVFDPRVLDRLRGRLYGVDQYAGIRLDYLRKNEEGLADIKASIDEARQNELQLGVGGGFDRINLFVQSRIRYKRRNFPFQLTNSEIELVPTFQTLLQSEESIEPEFNPSIRFTVTWYDFLFPMVELSSSAGFRYQQLEAYEWFGPDVGQTLSRPFFDDHIEASLGWRFYQYGYTDFRIAGPDDDPALWGEGADRSPQERLTVTGGQSVITIQPTLTYEGRDDALEPTRGWYARVGFDLGLATGAESPGFAVFTPEVRAYLPFFRSRLVLAARVNLAANLQGQLPAPRRYFAGGASSQRGFPQRRLSQSVPLVEFEDENNPGRSELAEQVGDAELPIGDEALIELNLEARMRLVKLFGFWFGAVIFVDGADLAGRIEQLRFPELHYATGLGLRYLTPVGAIRFDYGIRLNRRQDVFPCSDLGSCGQWHFSLGQAF